METDILIVGQGIAGTVLGETFIREGKSVLFIDQGHEQASSKVAAGMINPMAFKRIKKSWMADELLPVAKSFYEYLEKKLGQNFFLTHEILKFCGSDEYRKFWDQKSLDNEYIEPAREIHRNKLLENDFGFGRVTNCSRVVLTNVLKWYREYLIEHKMIIEDQFDSNKLNLSENTYDQIRFDQIILCQGHLGVSSEWFDWLPLQKTKGELLRIRAEKIDSDELLNRGFFIMPAGNDEYLVGSTYDWTDHTLAPTADGKKKIEDKLASFYKGPYSIIDHTAGLRPTVADRRPLIGVHPDYRTLGIFNGLGTKGVMLAPYFAKQFVGHILYGGQLNPKVDIKRFN